jgi:putative molybdopterin biosynthesis protein
MSTHAVQGTAKGGCLLNVNDVARLFGISRKTVYEMTSKGELEAVRVGQRLRYQPETLEKYLRDRRVRARGLP